MGQAALKMMSTGFGFSGRDDPADNASSQIDKRGQDACQSQFGIIVNNENLTGIRYQLRPSQPLEAWSFWLATQSR
jgi:hypothetical protein